MINKVHHIGIAVANLEESIAFYESNGFSLNSSFELKAPESKCAFMSKENSAGIELFEFADPSNLDLISIKNHVAYESSDIESDYVEMIAKGF